MALITCPECQKQVSDQAEACIHCGYPLKKKEDCARMKLLLIDEGKNDYKTVIDVVQEITHLERKDATFLVYNLPSCILDNITQEEYDKYAKMLTDVGAKVDTKTNKGIRYLNDVNQSNMMKCPTCGKDVSLEAYECPHCGHAFKKRGIGFFGIMMAVIVALIIMAFL